MSFLTNSKGPYVNLSVKEVTCTKCGKTFKTDITDSCKICFECMYPIK